MSEDRVTCLSDDTVARFADGHTDGLANRRIHQHLDRCPSCRQLVACLARHSEIDGTGSARATRGSPFGRASPSIAVGDELGRYRVVGYAGGGGMGVVYRAEDPELGRSVAIKIVRPSVGDPKAEIALRDEARALAGLSHPNIVPVFDVGVAQGAVYIVMELVEGPSLAGWLSAQKRTTAEVLAAFDQLACGLQSMHEASLVHRDVKPANVLVRDDGRVMVSDFGLVHRLSDALITAASSDSHASERPVGTAAYMAPEQIRGDVVTAASDQFSFFVSLFEALCEHPPFPSRTVADRYHRVVVRDVCPSIAVLPRWVRRIVLRGLAPEPRDRFATMEAARRALASGPRRGRGVALGVAAVVAVAALSLPSAPAPPSCAWLQDTQIWGPDARSEVEDAFEAVGVPYARASWARTNAALVQFDATWPDAAETTCRASEGKATPCLRQQHRRGRALVDVLRTVDRASLERTADLTTKLPLAHTCVDQERGVDRLSGPPQAWNSLARATALWDIGRFEDAEAEARQALAGARASAAPHLETEAGFQLGRAKSRKGELADAAMLLERAYWSTIEQGRPSLAAAAALELGFIAQETGNIGGSETWGKSARAQLDRLAVPDPLLEASLDIHFGAHALELEDFDKAMAYLLQAEAHLVSAPQPQPMNLAMLLIDQATILTQEGECDAAVEKFDRVVATLTEIFGPDHPDISEALNGIGSCHLQAGELIPAREKFRRALDIAVNSAGPRSPRAARFHANLASTLAQLGELDKADAHYDQALAVYMPDDSQPLAEAFIPVLGKANLARLRKDYPGARAWALKAGTVCQAFGTEHSCNGDVAYDLGGTAVLAGNFPEALRQAERATALWAASLGSEHPYVGVGLRNVGDAHLALDQPNEAATAYKRALDVLTAANALSLSGTVLSGLAEARLAQGHAAKAEDLAREALETPLAPIQRGSVELVLAKAIYAGGRPGEGVDSARATRARMVALGPHLQPYIDDVDAWLDQVRNDRR